MSEKIGISVKLNKDFSVIRETLERIGIINKKEKVVYPSCYCVESKTPGIYKIVHFKELFPLFDRDTNFDRNDKLRRNTTVLLLKNWKLIELVDSQEIDEIQSEKLSVLKHSEKSDYTIVHKFKFSTHVVVD
jgi:hypothetical protein